MTRNRPGLPALLAGLACLAGGHAPAMAGDKHYQASAWGELDENDNATLGGQLTFAPHGDVFTGGARIQLGASYDRYFYDEASSARITGETSEFNVLAGTAFSTASGQIALLAGPVVITDTASAPGMAKLSKSTFGGRLAVSAHTPLGHGPSLSLSGGYVSVLGGYTAAAAVRFPVSHHVSVGPAAQLTGNRNYWKLKVGPRVAGLKIAKLDIALSTGWTVQDGPKAVFLGISAGTGF